MILYILGYLLIAFIVITLITYWLGKPIADYPLLLAFFLWPLLLLIWMPYIAVELGDKLRGK